MSSSLSTGLQQATVRDLPRLIPMMEIAYHTFEEFEGRGLATQMARELVAIARRADPALMIVAQTLRETNASARILQKLGFTCAGSVHHPEDGEVLEWHLAPNAHV